MSQSQQLLNPRDELNTVLRNIFPNNREETRVLRARNIMKDCVSGLSEEDLEAYLTEFQYLIDYWLDSFEIRLFNGSTLKQTLGQA